MEITRAKRKLVEAELGDGEKVLWVGEPNPLRDSVQAIPILLFGVPWTILAVNFMWNWGWRGTGMDFAAVVFNGAFVVVGMAMLLAPAWAYSKARRSVYAITNERVLMIEGGPSKQVQSYREIGLGDIARKERADGSGDLSFAKKTTNDSDGHYQQSDIKFVGISRVRDVEQILRSAFCDDGRESASTS